MLVEFFAVGRAQTKGSAKGFGFVRVNGPRAGSIGVNITNDNTKAKGWAAIVAGAAREAYHGAPVNGPMRVRMVFFLPRPKSHRRSNGALKPGAPAFPIAKERDDADKLARCALDALTGILFIDDSQVVRLVAEKRYADGAAGASFEITPVDAG